MGYFNTIEDLGFFKNDRTDIRIFQTQHTRQVVAVEWSVGCPRRADVPAREGGHGAAHRRPVDESHAAGERVNPAGIDRRQRARRA